MNNIEDLIQTGYFQQYKKERDSGKKQSRSRSRGERQARNDEESVQKKKKEIFVIFQKFGIPDYKAHFRAATASRLDLMEVIE